MPAINFIAIALYAVAAGLIWRRAIAANINIRATAWTIRAIAAAAIALHGMQLYAQLYPAGIASGVNLALGLSLSLAAWMSALLFVIASTAKPILNLGVFVMPCALAGLAVGWLAPGDAFLLDDLPHNIGRHIAIAILAYGILSIACAQAIVLRFQEWRLRKPRGFFPALPAIETMESNLFQLTLLGFVLLTANLATGMVGAHQHYGTLLLFNHHIVLAFIAWGGFGALLLGRKIFGWRGPVAARLTIIAFAILVLAYFGTRFVRHVILA